MDKKLVLINKNWNNVGRYKNIVKQYFYKNVLCDIEFLLEILYSLTSMSFDF